MEGEHLLGLSQNSTCDTLALAGRTVLRDFDLAGCSWVLQPTEVFYARWGDAIFLFAWDI